MAVSENVNISQTGFPTLCKASDEYASIVNADPAKVPCTEGCFYRIELNSLIWFMEAIRYPGCARR